MTDQYARYDYAWKYRGWNVQNPVIPTSAYDPTINTGFPDDVSQVRVFGQWIEMDSGNGLEGVLRVWLPEDLVHVPSGSVVPAGQLPLVRFRSNEGLSFYLPATDDPQLTPTFTYHARLTVRGDVHEFDFALPSSLGEVNIKDLIGASPAAPDSPNGVVDGGAP
jgi:hypothetical protein